MVPVIFDAETFYSNDFSLSKMCVEEYVRDPRFELIGTGLIVNKERPRWVSKPTIAEYRAALADVPWDDAFVLCHNTQFDGFIIENVLGFHPKMYGDTLSMARPVHGTNVGGSLKKLSEHYGIGEKGTEVIDAKGKRRADFTPEELRQYGRYCVNDCVLTGKLFGKLRPYFTALELRVIDLTLRMAIQPVISVNTGLLEQALVNLKAHRRLELLELAAQLGVTESDPDKAIEGVKEMLSSAPKFAAFLESRGVVPPTKPSPANPEKETYAFAKTDPGLLELQESEDPLIVAAVEQRLAVKSTQRETRMETILAAGRRGLLPFPLRYAAAHTNRWGGEWGWNMQNLPKHPDLKAGRREPLRDCLGLPEGWVYVSCDSAQIEARVNAWFWGQHNVVRQFANGEDLYCDFASTAYGRPITKADVTERFVGKGCRLGLGFGMGPPKLQVTLRKPIGGISVDLPLEECERLVDIYRRTDDKIAGGWKIAKRAIDAMFEGATFEFGVGATIVASAGKLLLPSGNTLFYPGLEFELGEFGRQYSYLDREGRKRKRVYGAKTVENIVQAMARDIVAWQMVIIADRGWRVVGLVHDEIIVVAREEDAERCLKEMGEVMSTTPPWAAGCPVSFEGSFAPRYGDC